MKLIILISLFSMNLFADELDYRYQSDENRISSFCSVGSSSATCEDGTTLSDGGCSVGCSEGERASCSQAYFNTFNCTNTSSSCDCD